MATATLTAFVLGLFAGMAPGPYTTMVAATGFERGFRAAVPLAAAPLLTDLLPLLLSTLILTNLSPATLGVLGIIGGSAVIGIGVLLLVRYRGGAEIPEIPEAAPPTVRFWHVVASTSVSPAPWLFWLGIASPLLLRFWHRGWQEGVAFLVVLFATNIASALTLAWAASHGGRILEPRWRRRVLRGAGVALVLAGALLLVQVAQGDFAAITGPRDAVGAWVDSLTVR